MTKPRSARVRSDFWVHKDTEWMTPLDRCVYLHAAAHSCLGIVEMSTRKLARIHGVSREDVEASISRLVERKNCRWWDDLEILWVIEAADENLYGKAWIRACKEWKSMPAAVRDAIEGRYPDIITYAMGDGDGASGHPSDGRLDHDHDHVGVHVRRTYGVHRASSGHLQELDTIRRTAESKHDTTIGPFSFVDAQSKKQDPDLLFKSVGMAMSGYGWDTVKDVVAFAADETASGRSPSHHWKYMFRGDGFSAWHTKWLRTQDAKRGDW